MSCAVRAVSCLRQMLEYPARCDEESAVLVAFADELRADGQTVGAGEHRDGDRRHVHGGPDGAQRGIAGMPARWCFTGDRGGEQYVIWRAYVRELVATFRGKITRRLIALEAARQTIPEAAVAQFIADLLPVVINFPGKIARELEARQPALGVLDLGKLGRQRHLFYSGTGFGELARGVFEQLLCR